MSQSPVLEVRGLEKRFGQTLAVNGVSFAVQPGEVFTLLGPSGCGKSTTLRLVAGLERPDAGDVLLNGELISSAATGQHLPPERRHMGMVFQSYAIWPHMTVLDNVRFPLRMRRAGASESRKRVLDILDVVGLTGLESRAATQLSGGQQQRVALARALVHEPALLLLDEPLSNLDAKLREHMRSEIKRLQRRLGIAVLFVTHDQSEAMTLSDRVAVMNLGVVEQLGTPREVYAHPASEFVRDFLGRAVLFEGSVRRDADDYVLTLDGEAGARLRVGSAALPGLADGTRVVVGTRPEDARLLPLDAGVSLEEPNRLRVCVAETAFLGERIEYTLRTPGGKTLVVFGARHEEHPPGTELALVVDTAEASLWPA
ncbi:MAG: ABC transporter ATP-binding protein [Chloroflexi bacterium]|nr:ABC transporter ATP-binding protein [Chloroflexota bacterium]